MFGHTVSHIVKAKLLHNFRYPSTVKMVKKNCVTMKKYSGLSCQGFAHTGTRHEIFKRGRFEVVACLNALLVYNLFEAIAFQKESNF